MIFPVIDCADISVMDSDENSVVKVTLIHLVDNRRNLSIGFIHFGIVKTAPSFPLTKIERAGERNPP
jgi:hypothetical protein